MHACIHTYIHTYPCIYISLASYTGMALMFPGSDFALGVIRLVCYYSFFSMSLFVYLFIYFFIELNLFIYLLLVVSLFLVKHVTQYYYHCCYRSPFLAHCLSPQKALLQSSHAWHSPNIKDTFVVASSFLE